MRTTTDETRGKEKDLKVVKETCRPSVGGVVSFFGYRYFNLLF
jgi:hypothetical protein